MPGFGGAAGNSVQRDRVSQRDRRELGEGTVRPGPVGPGEPLALTLSRRNSHCQP